MRAIQVVLAAVHRNPARAAALNVFIPGGFEDRMPAIVEWFRTQG